MLERPEDVGERWSVYMTIRAVIFDIGGVLLRSEDRSNHKKWKQRLGLNEGEIYDVAIHLGMTKLERDATIGKVTVQELFRRIADASGMNEAELEEFKDAFWSSERLDTELAEFLKSLRPQYKTATLSNAWSEARGAVNHKFHLNELVDAQFFSAEEGVAKPNPQFYRIALDYLQVQPDEAVFLDDVPQNVEAARQLGMHAIHYRNTAQAIADVRQFVGQ
jgi:epoxide hydrolase-like predicted phosphatase